MDCGLRQRNRESNLNRRTDHSGWTGTREGLAGRAKFSRIRMKGRSTSRQVVSASNTEPRIQTKSLSQEKRIRPA